MGFEKPRIKTPEEADKAFMKALERQFQIQNVAPDLAKSMRRDLKPSQLVLSDNPDYDAELLVKDRLGKLTELEMEAINKRRARENQAAEAAE